MNHPITLSQGLSFALLAVFLLALGLWYFYPGAVRRWLPPEEEVPVPWGHAEVLTTFFLGFVLLPGLVQFFLTSIGFFHRLHPDLPAEHLGALGVQPEAGLPGGVPWGPLVLSVERGVIESARRGLWITAFSFPLQLAAVLVLLRQLSHTRLDQLGLSSRYFGRNLWAGLIGWVTVTPFVYGIEFLVEQWMRGRPESHALTKVAQDQPLAGEWIVIVFVAVVVAPVWEEVLFRGLIQRWLTGRSWGGIVALSAALVVALLERGDSIYAGWREQRLLGAVEEAKSVLFVLALVPGFLLLRWGLRSRAAQAIYGTAVFFAVGHSAWPQPIALFVLGLALGYLAHRTQSLVGPILLHALFNAVACVFLLVG